jgi:hypothetical protein
MQKERNDKNKGEIDEIEQKNPKNQQKSWFLKK